MNRHVVCGVLLLSGWWSHASGADYEFENMPNVAFVEMVNEADHAYGDKQYENAFLKYQRLACAGDKPSQAMLGRMYLSGQAGTRDDLKGYLWFKIASEYEFPMYHSTVKKIEAVLTPEQMKSTALLAEDMRKRYGLRATNVSCFEHSSSTFSSNVKDAVNCTPKRNGAVVLLRRCNQEEAVILAGSSPSK